MVQVQGFRRRTLIVKRMMPVRRRARTGVSSCNGEVVNEAMLPDCEENAVLKTLPLRSPKFAYHSALRMDSTYDRAETTERKPNDTIFGRGA